MRWRSQEKTKGTDLNHFDLEQEQEEQEEEEELEEEEEEEGQQGRKTRRKRVVHRPKRILIVMII